MLRPFCVVPGHFSAILVVLFPLSLSCSESLMPMRTTVLNVRGLLLGLAWLAFVSPLLAQGQVWRCGNEYTNQPGANPEARGCRLVEGGNLSIMEDARARNASPATAATPSTRPTNGQTNRPPASTSGARNPGERVDRTEQQARDRDARLILETELKRAQDRVVELEAEYNQGKPTPLASERGNDDRYRDRTEELKRRLERAQSDVAAIEREMARLPAAPR